VTTRPAREPRGPRQILPLPAAAPTPQMRARARPTEAATGGIRHQVAGAVTVTVTRAGGSSNTRGEWQKWQRPSWTGLAAPPHLGAPHDSVMMMMIIGRNYMYYTHTHTWPIEIFYLFCVISSNDRGVVCKRNVMSPSLENSRRE
jgi:hypothetical protein